MGAHGGLASSGDCGDKERWWEWRQRRCSVSGSGWVAGVEAWGCVSGHMVGSVSVGRMFAEGRLNSR